MTQSVLRPVSPTEEERDIELVLITGAGASREFGVRGGSLPLMGDWSDALIKKLSQRNLSYLDATGLRPGMTGEAFEIQLGRFLRQVEAFPLIEDLLNASVQFQALQNPALQGQDALKEWHRVAQHHLEQIVEIVRESLYEEFSGEGFDRTKASQSYAGLFQTLGLRGNPRWVLATTNYDIIAETAIEDLEGLPDWGQPPSTGAGAEAPLHVANILDGMPRYIPVLHLHGRVGWYRRIDGAGQPSSIYSAPITQHQQGFGVPIVMLPDPDKVYDADDVISSLWSQFRQALRRAKAVLVLGHSLNDRALVDAIVSNVYPLERVGVTLLAEDSRPDQTDSSALSTIQTIQAHLGNAGMITMRFGAADEDTISHGLGNVQSWLKRLDEKGLIDF